MTERRDYQRRSTAIKTTLETMAGQLLTEDARVLNVSVNGARIETPADLAVGGRYRVKLEGTTIPFEVSIHERVGSEYRCQIETAWDDLHDVIRQSDDLTLLVLESSDVPKGQD